jgi:hypothetical protein
LLLATRKTSRKQGIILWVYNNLFDFPSINHNSRFVALLQKNFMKQKVNKG